MTADKYGTRQTKRLTRATDAQLRYWNQIGLVPATGGGKPGNRRWYTFDDLVVLRAVVGLKDSGCSLQRIRRLCRYLHTVTYGGLRPDLLPALRNAAVLGVPRTEDLAGDLAKGQAMFVELLVGMLENAPPDNTHFWITDDITDRVTDQRDRLRLTATG